MTREIRELAPALWLGGLATFLHLLTAADGWDLFRDELYYVANSRHLGFGYVDHPPMIGWLTWTARALFGDSQFALRLLPALAAGATVFTVSRIAATLGGGLWSQLLAGAATTFAPAYISGFGYLSMNSFDVLFWALCGGCFVKLLETRDLRWWVPFGVLAGLALENKLSPLFLGFGVIVGLLVTRDWAHFASRWLWLGGALCALLFAPHLLWQAANGWPTVEFISNATQYKNLPVSPLGFLAAQGRGMGWPAAAVALCGLAFLLVGRQSRPFRAIGWAPVAILAFLILQRAKPYYFAPAWCLLFAAGGMAIEHWAAIGRWRWIRPLLLALLVSFGLLAAPLAKPLLDVETTVSYMRTLGVEPGTDERKEVGRLGQGYADRLGWRELAEAVAAVHRALPTEDQQRACVFGQNYGQAGAIDYYGPRLGLPPALSGHNSYWLWGPGRCSGDVVIVIDGDRDELETQFEKAEHAATYRCADCMPYEREKEIWVARRLRHPIEQAWPAVKHYD